MLQTSGLLSLYQMGPTLFHHNDWAEMLSVLFFVTVIHTVHLGAHSSVQSLKLQLDIGHFLSVNCICPSKN